MTVSNESIEKCNNSLLHTTDLDQSNETNSRENSERIWELRTPKSIDSNLHLPFRIVQLKNKIISAIVSNKVFMVNGSKTVRRSLQSRGWIEKKLPFKREIEFLEPYQIHSKVEEFFADYEFKPGDHVNNYFMLQEKVCSVLLTNVIPTFCWNCFPNCKSNSAVYEIPKNVIINRIGSRFTNKEILSKNLTELSRGNSNLNYLQFPRCYSSCDNEQREDFKENFRLTACMSVLKYLVHKTTTEGPASVYVDTEELPVKLVEFSIARLMEYIQYKKHEDLHVSFNAIKDEKWSEFLEQAHQFVHKKQKLRLKISPKKQNLIEVSQQLLKILETYWPQYHLDGMLNIWIIKPGYGSRGRNIHVTCNYNVIENLTVRSNRTYRWVIQKYVETPLLIYNTKFDIRVWFILKQSPLEIWIYKDCYLRFCSRSFDLSNFHESIHLANHCVQRKYKNHFIHPELPQNNMWHSNTFQAYLNVMGYTNKWNQTILPGIAQCITGAILSVESNIKSRPNSFQLYGADFIIDEKCLPWLIEINSSPDVSHTTTITENLVPRCMEDIIKVVIDTRTNPKAFTGRFSCIFSERIMHQNSLVMPMPNFLVTGTKIVKEQDQRANDVFTNSGYMIRNNLQNRVNVALYKIYNLHRIKKTTNFKNKKANQKGKPPTDELKPSKTVSSFEICLLKNRVMATQCLNDSEESKLSLIDNNNSGSNLSLPALENNDCTKPKNNPTQLDNISATRLTNPTHRNNSSMIPIRRSHEFKEVKRIVIIYMNENIFGKKSVAELKMRQKEKSTDERKKHEKKKSLRNEKKIGVEEPPAVERICSLHSCHPKVDIVKSYLDTQPLSRGCYNAKLNRNHYNTCSISKSANLSNKNTKSKNQKFERPLKLMSNITNETRTPNIANIPKINLTLQSDENISKLFESKKKLNQVKQITTNIINLVKPSAGHNEANINEELYSKTRLSTTSKSASNIICCPNVTESLSILNEKKSIMSAVSKSETAISYIINFTLEKIQNLISNSNSKNSVISYINFNDYIRPEVHDTRIRDPPETLSMHNVLNTLKYSNTLNNNKHIEHRKTKYKDSPYIKKILETRTKCLTETHKHLNSVMSDNIQNKLLKSIQQLHKNNKFKINDSQYDGNNFVDNSRYIRTIIDKNKDKILVNNDSNLSSFYLNNRSKKPLMAQRQIKIENVTFMTNTDALSTRNLNNNSSFKNNVQNQLNQTYNKNSSYTNMTMFHSLYPQRFEPKTHSEVIRI